MSGPVDRILAALREHGHEPRKAGAGWTCRCPAHDDRNPSLSIHAGDDGRTLLHCHAGCALPDVLGAVGLREADLFAPHADSSRRNGHAPKTRRRGDANSHAGERAFPTAALALRELDRRIGARWATWWAYHDASGTPIGLVARYDGPSGKSIRPVSKTAAGWIIGGMPPPRPLYALPELLATQPGARVYVTEGEKAADAARAVGLVATTSPHGSKSAAKADWSPLAEREVVILPDRDNSGELYAAGVARLATAAGARSVRIVRLIDLWAGMPEGGDVVDLVEHCGGDVDAIRAEVEALTNKTEPEVMTPDAPAVPAFTPFPVDVLSEPIRSFVADAAKSIGCDPSYVALPLLSGLAAAIGNTHRIALKRGWTEPAIVWTAIVGESGAAKSPALELALRPIRKRQHEAMKRHAAAMEEYRDALAMHERDAAQWKRSKSDTPPPAKPEAPIADRCWTDDATTEALAVLLQQNPRGLLMVRDELSGWIGGFDRYSQGGRGGTDAAKWLEMFGGRPMVVDRKTGGTLYVPRAAVSIAGGIQPETLRRALGQEHRDNGLAARLLLTCPPRKPKRWTEADVDADTEAAVAAVFDRLFSLTMEVDPESADPLNPDLRPRLVRLADDGKRAWVTFYNEHATEQAELSGDLSAAWSKLEGYAARLALVIHLTSWAAGDATLRDPARVDEASIAAGVVLARWFGDEARRVYAILSESDDDRETRRLVELIRRMGGDVSGRELVQRSRMFKTVADAEAALSRLVEAGAGSWVTPEQRGRGGPKARRFVLSPVYTVNVYRNASGDTGNANPVDVDGVDAATDAGDGWGEL